MSAVFSSTLSGSSMTDDRYLCLVICSIFDLFLETDPTVVVDTIGAEVVVERFPTNRAPYFFAKGLRLRRPRRPG